MKTVLLCILMAKKQKALSTSEPGDVINWAVLCHLQPHQLAYRINRACNWDLCRLHNLAPNPRTKTGGYPLFRYHENDMIPVYYLIALKKEKSNLVQDLNKFDFVLQIRLHDDDTRFEPEVLMQQIKSIDQVLGVFEVNTETLKGADALYFDTQLDTLEVDPPEVKKLKKPVIIKNQQ